MKLPCLLAFLGLLGACEHHAPLRPSGGNPGVYVAPDGTCPATCSTPSGSSQSFASDADGWAALLGAWRMCAGAHSLFADAPADTIGVEFAPPHTDLGYDAAAVRGNLYFLTQGPSGPVRGGGFDYQQTYTYGDGVLFCQPYYNSIYSFNPKYSPCPRAWQLQNGGRVALLVPF
jgi:hypothetical protein